jgi:hypothetical protein
MYILNKELVRQAVQLATPAVSAILKADGMTWGPKWLEGWVNGPGLDEPVSVKFGKPKGWDKGWGERRDFSEICREEAVAYPTRESSN